MQEAKKPFVELLRGFDNGILVTKTMDGSLHGRPMGVVKIEEDGTVYFSASLVSPKIAEISADAAVGVFFQDARQWISLSGKAEVVRDRALIDELWSERWKLWFADGKESSALCLLRITPSFGEYWDVSGRRGTQFALEALKADGTGTRPDRAAARNAKVAL